jgi:SAM-dependent methyltransferase
MSRLFRAKVSASDPLEVSSEFKGEKRYLSRRRYSPDAALAAARSYVGSLSTEAAMWLWRKPFDPSPGNPNFFEEMYQLLGLIKAMKIQPAGRVLEIGSGPGWVSELLVALGFDVDGLEPSEDMIRLAQQRIAGFRSLRKIPNPPEVRFHCSTLEDFNSADESFDAIIFHEALHHIIDETKALLQCYRLLRPGGVIGIDEGAWVPGSSQALEEQLEKEMRLYGTMENPFTVEYLDHLLRQAGFVKIVRYHGVYHLVPADDGDKRLSEIADAPAERYNNLTAYKPSSGLDTRDADARTLAGIVVKASRLDTSARKAIVSAVLTNIGETRWLCQGKRSGYVTIALRQEEPGSPAFVEALGRQGLPKDVPPGESVELELAFHLPAESGSYPWVLDLVNEGIFWFSMRGTQAPALPSGNQ